MAHPEYIRKKAIQLRVEKKLTIDEIAERLSLNKTTIYYWVKSIPIPGTEKQTAARKAAARANSERARLKREAAYQRGAEEFEELSKDPTFRDFTGRSWRLKYGVLQVRSSDTYLRARLQAWMDRIETDWE